MNVSRQVRPYNQKIQLSREKPNVSSKISFGGGPHSINAAAEDPRPLTSLVEKLLAEHLREKGYLEG